MIDGSTHYWSAASNAPRPFLFESLVMSIIFAHQAKLERMKEDLAKLRSEVVSAQLRKERKKR